MLDNVRSDTSLNIDLPSPTDQREKLIVPNALLLLIRPLAYYLQWPGSVKHRQSKRPSFYWQPSILDRSTVFSPRATNGYKYATENFQEP